MTINNFFKLSPLVLAMLIAACTDPSSGPSSKPVEFIPQAVQDGQTPIPFTPKEAPEGAILSIVTNPEQGTLTVTAEGQLEFDPGDDFKALAKGETQKITFKFSDGTSDYTSFITVTGVNDQPVTESLRISKQLSLSASGELVFTGSLTVTDPDNGDTHTFAVKNQQDAEFGSVVIAADGSFIFTPAANFPELAEGEERELSFTYTASDDYVSSNPSKVTLIITGGDFGENTRPEVEDIPALLVGTQGQVTGQFKVTDANGDEFEIKIVNPPSKGTLTVNADNTFSYDPGTDFANLAKGTIEEVSFTYQAVDSSGKANAKSILKTVTITVSGGSDGNSQPMAQKVNLSVIADGLSSVKGQFAVLDMDAKDTHTYKLETIPLKGTVTSKNDGSFTYTPGDDFNSLAQGYTQNVTFTYIAIDSASKENSTSLPAFVTVVVTGVNADAVANHQPEGLGQAYELILDGSQLTKFFDVVDLDADTHTFEITQPSEKNGSVVNNNDGSFTFVPGTDFIDLVLGSHRLLSFSYTVIDSSGAANNRSTANLITIDVKGLNNNQRPEVASFAMSAAVATGIATATLIATDVDVTDTHTFTTTQPERGHVTVVGSSLSFDPASDFATLSEGETQKVSFSYSADDGSMASNALSLPATVTVTVTGENDKPTAGDNHFSTTQNGEKVGKRFAKGDVDLSDVHTYELVKLPIEGEVIYESGSDYAFDPKEDFKWLAEGVTEDFTFEYIVIDNHGAKSEPGIITISITGINDAPVSVADSYAVNEGEIIVVNAANGVLKNDSDIDLGDSLSAELVTDVEHGILILNADGAFSYDHDGSETKSDSFVYKVKDATLYSKEVTVSIVVTPVPDHKVVTTTENSPLSVASVIPDNEAAPDGNVTYELVSGLDKGRLILNADGSFEFDPLSNFNELKAGETETLNFTYKVTDTDTGLSETADVSINVLGEADIDFILSSTKISRGENDISYDISAYSEQDITIAIDIANDPRARYRNSFGYYFANALGEPISGQLVMVNSYTSSGLSGSGKVFSTIIANEDIPLGATSVGFFLVPNGGHNEGEYYIDPLDENNNDITIYNLTNNLTTGYVNGAKVTFTQSFGVWVAKTATNYVITAIGPSHGSLRGGCSLSSSNNQLIFSNPALNYNAGLGKNYNRVEITGDFTAWANQDMVFNGCNAWTKVISSDAGNDNFHFLVNSQPSWYGASNYTKVNLSSGAGNMSLPSGKAFYDVTVYDDSLWLVIKTSEVEPLDPKVSVRILDQEGKDIRSGAGPDDFIFGDMPGIDDVDDLYLTYTVIAGNNFASNEDEYITGDATADVIDARGGNDILVTGKGSDVMTGGSSFIDPKGLAQDDDKFIWLAGHYGTDAKPDEDKILDFGVSGGNDDTLDVSGLVATCMPAASCITVSIVKNSTASGGGIKEGDTLLTITPELNAKVTISLQGWDAADWFSAYPDAGWTDVDDVVAHPELLIEALIASRNLFVETK